MRAGRVSASTRSSAGQSGPFGPLEIVVRGWAARVSVSPLAMPMRLRPKSKARTTMGCDWAWSGMSGKRGELPGFDAEQTQRGAPALFVGQIEDHALIGGNRQPGVVQQLLLELTGFPARVAQRDECLVGTGAGGHGGEHVARGGHLDRFGDLVGGIPFTAGTVQNE